MNKERRKATINRTMVICDTDIVKPIKMLTTEAGFCYKVWEKGKNSGRKNNLCRMPKQILHLNFSYVSYCMSYTLYNKNLIKQMSALFEDN